MRFAPRVDFEGTGSIISDDVSAYGEFDARFFRDRFIRRVKPTA